MANLNPLNITGPGWPGNYQQSDVRIPAVSPAVASYPKGTNVLSLTWPLPRFTEKLSDKDDPQHTIRNG